MSWKSKYGVVGISVFGKKNLLADAANEKGLYISALWFDDVKYPEIHPGDAVIDTQNFLAWVAGNFASVAELKEALGKVKVYAAPGGLQRGTSGSATLAGHRCQRQFRRAGIPGSAIEDLDNRQNGVLTNDPNLGWHLDNLRFFSNLKAFAFPVPSSRMTAGRWARI